MTVSAGSGAGEVSVPATVSLVSFIGREAEVHGRTADGTEVKAIVRPTEEILGLTEGAAVTFGFNRDDVLIFENHETGRRLS